MLRQSTSEHLLQTTARLSVTEVGTASVRQVYEWDVVHLRQLHNDKEVFYWILPAIDFLS